MISLVNEAVMSLINDGFLTGNKIRKLVYVKDLVDRISMKNYLEENDVKELLKKYGVMPNIVTWGDYFQTELASTLKDLSDSAFNRVVDTVRFDLVSSYEIFSEQSGAFFAWVDKSYADITSIKQDGYTEEENEIIHLKILKDYYVNLGITNNFTQAEMSWYESYGNAKAM